MKPAHKKYILGHLGRKPLKKIAQELNLKQGEIKRFLKENRPNQGQNDSARSLKPSAKRNRHLISIVLIVILGLACYSNSLNNKFIWDDNILIRDNLYIKDSSKIGNIFSENIAAGAGVKYDFYRPLQMLTYMFDYSLYKLDVRGYHLTNILLHILAALCVYWFINILYGQRLLSSAVGILFVVHPIHTEAVTYISGRSDSLALIFLLLAFIFYIQHYHSHNVKFYILMLLSYVFALLSRESSLFLPALLLLYHYSFKKEIRIMPLLSILGLGLIYVLLRMTLLSSELPQLTHSNTAFQRLPGFFVAITNYLRLLFLPLDLHMEYRARLFSFANLQAIAGIIILFAALIVAFRKKEHNQLLSFSIFWFFIGLLPLSNIYHLNAYMAEHWLYLPSIGLFLFLARSLLSLYKMRNARIPAIVFAVGLLSFYLCLTIRQNTYWKEPVSFYERTLNYAPDSPRVLNNLGNAYKDMGKVEQAIDMFKRAIESDPKHAKSYNNLGLLYSDMKNNKQALSLLEKAVEIEPNFADAYNNLGIAYRDSARTEEAVAALKKAIEINPNFAKAYNNLGGVYFELGKKQEAINFCRKAIEIDPNYIDPYRNLAFLYYRQKQYGLAIEYFDQASSLGRVDPVLLEVLKPYRAKEQHNQ